MPAGLDEVPVLVDESYFNENEKEEQKQKQTTATPDPAGKGHLIVLVHGFLGNSYDMVQMKNLLCWRYPEAQTYCSADNEDATEGDIQTMGERLAKEVRNYVKEWFPNNTMQRLSFVGHSLGGLIIRAALPRLEEYKAAMHTYFTLSSPHLGCMYQSSTIVGAGMWLMKKWKKSLCLEQLAMTDSTDATGSFVYKLSLSEVRFLHKTAR